MRVAQHLAPGVGLLQALLAEVQQELDLLVEARGVAIHLHPGVVAEGGQLVVLGGNDQALLGVGEQGFQAPLDERHGHELGVPVQGQHAALLGVGLPGGDGAGLLLGAEVDAEMTRV